MSTFPASNFLLTGIFLFCLVTLAAGALLAVFSARLIRSVCGLAICSVGLAGLYYFLHSPFLALMEILIYIGAVCVTIVFAVMLAEPEEPANEEKAASTLLWGGMALGVSLAIFCTMVWLGAKREWTTVAIAVNDGSLRAIGISLLTTYSLAFELISLALLVAILGALAIARAGRTLPPLSPASVQAGERKSAITPASETALPCEVEEQAAEALALTQALRNNGGREPMPQGSFRNAMPNVEESRPV
jgi:NADH-quinone oxidoreductase subunit J